MASNNENEIIELEIISLKKALDKYNTDYIIMTGMIEDLIDDRIGISKESTLLTEMITNREKILEGMGKT